MNFDENIIITIADRLYRRAATLVLTYVVLGLIVGALVGLGAAQGLRIHEGGGVAVAVALLVAVIAGAIAGERAFALRLQAQTALCQLQIERNTRSRTASSAPPIGPPEARMPPLPPPAATRTW